MATYAATIQHHSISRARWIKIKGDISAAKRVASREFRGEFLDYVIVIYEDDGNYPIRVASRRVGNRKWATWNDQ